MVVRQLTPMTCSTSRFSFLSSLQSFVKWGTIAMHHLNTNATLSPTEFASLRHVANGLVSTVPIDHVNLLIAMRLACFDGRQGLVITDLGWHQLECADIELRQDAEVQGAEGGHCHRAEHVISLRVLDRDVRLAALELALARKQRTQIKRWA